MYTQTNPPYKLICTITIPAKVRIKWPVTGLADYTILVRSLSGIFVTSIEVGAQLKFRQHLKRSVPSWIPNSAILETLNYKWIHCKHLSAFSSSCLHSSLMLIRHQNKNSIFYIVYFSVDPKSFAIGRFENFKLFVVDISPNELEYLYEKGHKCFVPWYIHDYIHR